MLQLYDVNKNKIKGLTAYKDYCIESVLKTGDKTLSFLYPKKLGKEIKNEGYVRNKTDEFVIKSIDNSGDWLTINASLNVEDLEGKEWESFSCLEQTIEQCLTLACADTGWTVNVTGVTKKRTVRMTNCNSWDIVQQARKTYLVEIKFDTINKIIIIKEKQGQDKGTYFTEDLNLKKIDISNDSYDFFTRIKPIGKDGLKINVNGKDYLENYQYSSKVKTLIWKDERYTVADSLKEDATIKLNELSKPRIAYTVDIIDLGKLNSKYKNILDYGLGDTIYLVSKENNIREKQRIVKIKEYPDEVERNSCEIANTVFTFEDIQKEYSDTTDTVNNITSDNGTVSEGAISSSVKNLTVDKVNMNDFTALTGRVGYLEVNKLNVDIANIKFAEIDKAFINVANITDLTATNIKFNVASGGTLDLQTLLAKFVTGENGQFLNLTTDNVVIANAIIKDAMIENVSLNKLKAGTINTNNINLASADGGLSIVGPTMQFKDKSNKIRLQLGQDTAGDFNFILRAADGTTTLIDGYGIKEKAIADKLIKSNMVNDGAIGEQQINYSSLVTGLNKDTNTSLIQASKVAIDLTGQKLDVAFDSLKSTVNDTKSKTESNITSIGVINGQIDTLIKDTTIIEDGTTVKLKDSYSTLKQTVNGINTTVASHTTSITNLGTNVTNAQNTANNANALADSKAKVFTSTPTTPYKVGDIWTGGPSGEIMKCKVARSTGSYVAEDWEKASKYTDDTKAVAVEGKVTIVETKQATLEQNLEGFKTTVSSTYSTKTELSTLNGTVTSIQQRVNTVEQSITATALTTTISSAINAGTSSITTTQFIMDKSGFTVKNGAIKIQNKAGNTVLTADTDGNLLVQNSLTIGGNTNGNIQVKNDSSVNIFSANKNGVFLKDGLMKVTSGNVNWDGITYPEGGTKEMTVYANGIMITQKDYSGSQEYINKADYLYNQMKIVEDNRSNALGTYFETTVTASSIQTSGTITAIGSLVIGSSMQYPTLPATKTLITIYPPYHTGGPWYLKGNDASEKAYLDLNYGSNLRARIDSDGIFLVDRLRGIGGDSFWVGSNNARIDATEGIMRLYTSTSGSADNGIMINKDGSVQIKCNSVNRHIFFAGGTKTGGTMEVEGTVYGMSPTDSPQTLIEYIIPDLAVEGELRLELDSIYIKMISYYVSFLSNKNIEIKEKGQDYIILEGAGTTDVLIKGQRKDAEEYYRIMGGFTHGSESEVSY